MSVLLDTDQLRDLAYKLPALNLRHLRVLTDDTGVLQHARFSIPHRDHGYCTDDNARALVAVCWGNQIGLAGPDLGPAVSTYLAFLNHAFNEDTGRFRNFLTYDRRWTEASGSDDAQGRALWGAGVAAAIAPGVGQRDAAAWLLHRAVPATESCTSPRAWAYAILGLDAYLNRHPASQSIADRMHELANRLENCFTLANDDVARWHWPEHYLTYDNAILPLGLLVAARRLNNEAMRATGLRSLRWLTTLLTAADGHLSLIGSEGWMTRGETRAQFDQQPLDACAIVLASAEAYAVTEDAAWIDHVASGIEWFAGRNDSSAWLYDADSGGCFDGLCRHGVNANCGAESTLAWLLARCRVEMLPREHAMWGPLGTSVHEQRVTHSVREVAMVRSVLLDGGA